MTQIVYFFAFDGRIKVGYSSRWSERLRTWRRQLGEHIEIIGTIPGDTNTERSIHKALSRDNVGGEWFRDCLWVRAEIKRIIKSSPKVRVVTEQKVPVERNVQFGPYVNFLQKDEFRKRAWDRFLAPIDNRILDLEAFINRQGLPSYHIDVLDDSFRNRLPNMKLRMAMATEQIAVQKICDGQLIRKICRTKNSMAPGAVEKEALLLS